MISTMRFIVMCLCLTVTSSAYAGSYRRFFYGDDAAMTASAGTALMTDTGAIWYNPAGLGGNQFKKLQLSGTAYGLHVRRLNKILQTHINDQSHIVGKSLNNVSIVPSAFSVAFALNDKVSFGFGLFQTENNTFSLRAAQTLDITPVSSWNAGMEYHEKTIQYTAGPALGIQISDDLKWGIANFGVYDSQDASLRLHAGYNRDNTSGQSDTMGIDSQYLQRQVATTYVTTGIQWRVSDNWHSGLLLRSPAFQLWRQRSLSQFDATAFDYSPSNQTSTTVAGESIIFEYVEDSESSFDTKITAPGEIRLAIAYCPGPNWVGAEVGYQLPLEKENHHQVFNASLGAHMKLTPKAGVGIGLFTDNDSQMRFEGMLVKPGNRLGATVGIQVRSTELVEKLAPTYPFTDDKEATKTRRRVLVTTLSVTYSLQKVDYRIIGFAANPNNETFSLGPGTDDTIFHRVDIHLGGGFFF